MTAEASRAVVDQTPAVAVPTTSGYHFDDEHFRYTTRVVFCAHHKPRHARRLLNYGLTITVRFGDPETNVGDMLRTLTSPGSYLQYHQHANVGVYVHNSPRYASG